MLNALLLVLFSFLWLNYSYILSDDEEVLIKATTGLKDIALGNVTGRHKPDNRDFLFVNIAWEKQLIPVSDSNGMVVGKRAITDRKRLARFFELINKNPHYRFLLLDVWFADSSDYSTDSLLQVQLDRTKNFLIPYHKDPSDDNRKVFPIFQAPCALSDYEKDDMDNNFIKFRLVQGNGFKTTPLVMYEHLHHRRFTDNGLFHTSGNRLCLNSFILNLRIWANDLKEEAHNKDTISSRYTKVQLADLIGPDTGAEATPAALDNMYASLIDTMTRNRIVVIGDFEDTDIHNTIYGATPGPLILLNTYLALKDGDNLISMSFILFLFMGFFLISLKCFTQEDPIDLFVIHRLISGKGFRTFLSGLISYVIYLGMLSVITYFLFNVHLTILYLAIYFEVLDQAIHFFKNRSESGKEAKTTLNPEIS